MNDNKVNNDAYVKKYAARIKSLNRLKCLTCISVLATMISFLFLPVLSYELKFSVNGVLSSPRETIEFLDFLGTTSIGGYVSLESSFSPWQELITSFSYASSFSFGRYEPAAISAIAVIGGIVCSYRYLYLLGKTIGNIFDKDFAAKEFALLEKRTKRPSLLKNLLIFCILLVVTVVLGKVYGHFFDGATNVDFYSHLSGVTAWIIVPVVLLIVDVLLIRSVKKDELNLIRRIKWENPERASSADVL